MPESPRLRARSPCLPGHLSLVPEPTAVLSVTLSLIHSFIHSCHCSPSHSDRSQRPTRAPNLQRVQTRPCEAQPGHTGHPWASSQRLCFQSQGPNASPALAPGLSAWVPGLWQWGRQVETRRGGTSRPHVPPPTTSFMGKVRFGVPPGGIQVRDQSLPTVPSTRPPLTAPAHCQLGLNCFQPQTPALPSWSFLPLSCLHFKQTTALAGVAQWIECRPVNQRAAGLIP